ncbi:MAG: MFS transporter [Ktedonobacterales bacterium]
MLATLRNRDFALVWFAGLISLTGDWLLKIGLPIYIYTLTGSALATSVMFMAGIAPRLLLGSVAGVFVDRWNRKVTMIVTNLLLALGLLPLLLVQDSRTLWIAYAVAFIEAMIAQFFAPAESAMLPTLVREDELVPANALNALNSNIGRLGGPALGGLVVAAAGLRGVALLDALSFLLAAALVLLIAPVARPAAGGGIGGAQAGAESVAAAEKGMWREWLAGLRLVRRNRVLRVYFVMFAAMGLGEGVISVLLVVFAERVLRGGAELLGLMMSAQAIGGLIGGLIVAPFGKRISPYRLLGVCAFLFGLIDVAIVDVPAFVPLAAATTVVLALFVAVGIPSIGLDIGIDSGVQMAVPNAYLGRVLGAATALMSLLMLCGMALAGTLGDRVGAVPLLNIQGGMYVCAGLLALVALRGVRAGSRSAQSDGAPVNVADEMAIGL